MSWCSRRPPVRPWNKSNFSRIFLNARKAIEDAGIPPHSMHAFRHTFASLCLKKMEYKDVGWVANQLGHSLQVFHGIYAHLIKERRDTSFMDPRLSLALSSVRDLREL